MLIHNGHLSLFGRQVTTILPSVQFECEPRVGVEPYSPGAILLRRLLGNRLGLGLVGFEGLNPGHSVSIKRVPCLSPPTDFNPIGQICRPDDARGQFCIVPCLRYFHTIPPRHRRRETQDRAPSGRYADLGILFPTRSLGNVPDEMGPHVNPDAPLPGPVALPLSVWSALSGFLRRKLPCAPIIPQRGLLRTSNQDGQQSRVRRAILFNDGDRRVYIPLTEGTDFPWHPAANAPAGRVVLSGKNNFFHTQAPAKIPNQTVSWGGSNCLSQSG
ncbi:hypothetical protein C8R46DRAFT_596291 [Mycena filopes]|nr:hypothetical protein C8R46DRAFT_596291 [Mycena filopes]